MLCANSRADGSRINPSFWALHVGEEGSVLSVAFSFVTIVPAPVIQLYTPFMLDFVFK